MISSVLPKLSLVCVAHLPRLAATLDQIPRSCFAQLLEVRYTLGPEIETNHYHVAIVRSQLTRNLSVLFDDIRDEISCAFDDVISAKAGGSVSFRAAPYA
jgi:hypothetical protein